MFVAVNTSTPVQWQRSQVVQLAWTGKVYDSWIGSRSHPQHVRHYACGYIRGKSGLEAMLQQHVVSSTHDMADVVNSH